MTPVERVVLPPVRWRLTWRNPANARDALYIASHAGAIEGMEDARSRALLARLIDEATQSPHVYSHRWRAGDVILWDNRATMHRGRPWPGTQARLMVRTTISARDIDGLIRSDRTDHPSSHLRVRRGPQSIDPDFHRAICNDRQRRVRSSAGMRKLRSFPDVFGRARSSYLPRAICGKVLYPESSASRAGRRALWPPQDSVRVRGNKSRLLEARRRLGGAMRAANAGMVQTSPGAHGKLPQDAVAEGRRIALTRFARTSLSSFCLSSVRPSCGLGRNRLA